MNRKMFLIGVMLVTAMEVFAQTANSNGREDPIDVRYQQCLDNADNATTAGQVGGASRAGRRPG